ncbi:MAG: hypothetical protein LC804_11590, partial [Acidobacteria bacterium]|nr:hypothetical protein [Acidobacteriota bacterium]
LFGRVDAWLLPDPDLRRVCAVQRNGVWRGIYIGSPVLEDQDALARFISSNPARSVTVAILATPKFGYSEQYTITRRVANARSSSERSCGSVELFRFEH